jgi:hypothetical protein
MTLLLTNGRDAGHRALPPISPGAAPLAGWERACRVQIVVEPFGFDASLAPEEMLERAVKITHLLEGILSHGVPHGGINE